MVQHTYNGWPIESRVWSIEQRHFQWSWTTSTPSFKVTPFFDAEYLINGTIYRHSFDEIPRGTYTRPTQQCHFEWPWVSLSDLAKYSMARSVARSLCDSWASCLRIVAMTNVAALWIVVSHIVVLFCCYINCYVVYSWMTKMTIGDDDRHIHWHDKMDAVVMCFSTSVLNKLMGQRFVSNSVANSFKLTAVMMSPAS